MNKFQPVRFHSVDDLLAQLPGHERAIVDFLRRVILDSIPQVTERLAYNVPFYYRHSRICFLWPSSVPWGKVRPQGVQFGFVNGHLMHDENGYLERGDRRQVFTRTFRTAGEIDPGLLKAYIFEAVEIDASLKAQRKRNFI